MMCTWQISTLIVLSPFLHFPLSFLLSLPSSHLLSSSLLRFPPSLIFSSLPSLLPFLPSLLPSFTLFFPPLLTHLSSSPLCFLWFFPFLPAFSPQFSPFLTHSSSSSLLFILQPVDDVAQYVDRGYRMDAPDGCPDTIFRIMQECWNKDRTQRPNFAQIQHTLESVQPS